MGRPMLARLLAGAMATAAIVTVSGCSGEQPAPTSAPVDTTSMPTPAATFASDEEALAAGVAAVERANELTTKLINDPSLDLESVQDVATDSYVDTMTEQVKDYRDKKRRVEGQVALTPDELVYQKNNGGTIELQFYYCADDGEFKRFNSDGTEYAVGNDRNTARMIATVKGSDARNLKLSEVNVWEHGVTCA